MNKLAILSFSLFASACLPSFEAVPADPEEPPIDNPPPPPAPTEVSVSIREAGVAVAGVTVIFQNADDTVIAEAVTDATGIAKTAMPNGGNATVIRTTLDVFDQPRTELFTYAGVKPGDALELFRPTAAGTPVNVRVTVPADALYTILTPCGSATGAGEIEIVLAGCGAETDFFVTDIGDPEAGSFLARRPVAATVDLAGEAVRQNRETTLLATNIPDQLALTLEKRLVANGFELFRSPEVPVTQSTQVPDIGTASADQLVLAKLARAEGGTQIVASRQPYGNGTATVDVGPGVIPFVADATYDGTTVTWTEDGAGTPDFVLVTLDNAAGITRTIAAAHVGSAMRVPRLPATHAMLDLDGALVSHSIAKVTGGFDAARARLFGSSIFDATPMNGQITVSSSLGE